MRRNAASTVVSSCFAVGLMLILGCDEDGGGGGGAPPASYSVLENAGSATITVTRTGGSGGAATVDYATSDGTAKDGTDYTAASATLTWTDGESGPKVFTVDVTDDAVDEADETVNLTLSNVTGASLGAPSRGVLTIVDEDAPGTVEFSEATYSVVESGGAAVITVMRTGGFTGVVAVDYATISGGTAEDGTDYTGTSGTLTWNDGVGGPMTFTVNVTDDIVREGDETVMLELTNPSVASLGSQRTAVLTIVDDDGPGTLEFSQDTYLRPEGVGPAPITVMRTGGSGGAVGVDYATSNGTALDGSDYASSSGTLGWDDGETVKTFEVAIADDGIPESDETVNLTLSNPTGGASLGSQRTAVLTILGDRPGTLQFSEATYSVDEDGMFAMITVARTGGFGGFVSVECATSDGTALDGFDYTAASTTLNWGNWDMSDKTFMVAITDDVIVEGSETVNLTLSNPGGGASLGSQRTAVLTILDADGPGTIQFAP